MAARKENLLSLEHLTGPNINTFRKQQEQRFKMSRGMDLQQRWQELKERELIAQQNNRQLLQQFNEAQDTLNEMLTLTAAMKTIRMEYELYLEESCPRWQQQLKEKTQAAQRKSMEYLKSCLKNTEERKTASSADQPLRAHGSTIINHDIAAPPKHHSPNRHLNYNQDGSHHHSYVQSSWQTHPQSQTARFPIRALNQPQGSSHVPPSFLPPHIFTHPHSLQLHHLTPSPGDGHHRPRQNPPGWAALQSNYPWSWAAGAAGIPSGFEALWDQLYTQELPPEVGIAQGVRQETDSSSKRERGGGSRSSRLSQELDVKPVRLSGGISESSESTRESSQESREDRKKTEEGGRSQCSSSHSRSCVSQDSSRSSSAIVIATVKVVQSSESDSSEKGRTSTRRKRRSGGLAVGSPRDEKLGKGSKGDEPGSHNEESQSTSEELGSLIEKSRSENVEDQTTDDKSESCGEEPGSQKEAESGSISIKIENGCGDEIEKQESSSSEQSNVSEKDEDDLDGEKYENSQTDEEQEERDGEEDHEASEKNNATEEEEETGAEDEEQDSEDEEVDENKSDRGDDNMEESDEEDQRGDLAGEPEEERDSDDSIISPQDKSKKMHIIPEEASEEDEEREEDEEEEGSKTGSSDGDSNEISDEDEVENLLAPQELLEKKEEKDLRADEQSKAICDNVEIFQVKPDKSTKPDHPSDSDEFDSFYG